MKYILLSSTLIFILFSCDEREGNKASVLIPNQSTISNNYICEQQFNEVVIGNQIWMTKNLIVTRFRNGDQIIHCQTNKEWEEAYKSKTPAWCFYDKVPLNSIHGLLYNKYAIIDKRGIAPNGYHIPSEKEFIELSKSFKYNWEGIINKNCNQSLIYETFFKHLLGSRNDDGTFFGFGVLNFIPTNEGDAILLDTAQVLIPIDTLGKGGYCVRCIKN